jgi:hypothetical protein
MLDLYDIKEVIRLPGINSDTLYLPYSRDGVTIWAIFAGSNENQPTAERENPEKKVAFIHKTENLCSKVEIRGGDRLVKSLGTDEMFCAIYR